MDGGKIDRGGSTKPALPTAGSSVPKASRKPRPIGGPATAGA
jgi:cell division protease FtsH